MRLTPSIRKVALLAATALVTGTALLAPAAPAKAATEFAITGIRGLVPTVVVPTTTTTKIPLSLFFSGDPVTNNLSYRAFASDYTGPSVLTVRSQQAANHTKPYLGTTAGSITPGTAVPYSLEIGTYTTPGRYRLTFPISQSTWTGSSYAKVDKSATVEINVVANSSRTLASSSLYGSGKMSSKSKWSWSYYGPEYVRGATIKIYYKAKGKKKYTKIASAKLNASGDASFKSGKGKIRKTGYAYYVITAVPYSAQVKSATYKIVKR